MCVRMSMCMRVCIYVHACIYVGAWLCVRVSVVCVCVCIYVCACVYICVRASIYVCVCVYIRVRVCMYCWVNSILHWPTTLAHAARNTVCNLSVDLLHVINHIKLTSQFHQWISRFIKKWCLDPSITRLDHDYVTSPLANQFIPQSATTGRGRSHSLVLELCAALLPLATCSLNSICMER